MGFVPGLLVILLYQREHLGRRGKDNREDMPD